MAADSALPADESMATTAVNNDTVSSGSVKMMEDGTNVTNTVGEKDQKRAAVEAKDARGSGTENRLDTVGLIRNTVGTHMIGQIDPIICIFGPI